MVGVPGQILLVCEAALGKHAGLLVELPLFVEELSVQVLGITRNDLGIAACGLSELTQLI